MSDSIDQEHVDYLINRLTTIEKAVKAQANDPSIWSLNPPTITEAHLLQSLRWLHYVIQQDCPDAFKNIIEQSEDLQEGSKVC